MITQLRIRVLIFFGLISHSFASDICACQPSRYRITLDLGLTCDNSTVLNGDPGIYDVACTITGPKTTPVGVTSVIISEIDQSLNAIGKTQYDGPLTTSDSIRYNSTIAASKGDSTVVPRGIQVEINAYDASKNLIVNKWVLLYNNDCNETPVLATGQHIGWTVFSNLIDPPVGLCPMLKTTIAQVIRSDTSTSTPVATIVQYPTLSPIETTYDAPVSLVEDTTSEARSEVSHGTGSSKKGSKKKSKKSSKKTKSKAKYSSKHSTKYSTKYESKYSTKSQSKGKTKYSSKYSTKTKKSPPSKKSKKSPKSKKSKSSKSGKGHTEPGEYYDLINSTKDGTHLDTSAARQLSDEDTNGSYKLPAQVTSSKSSKSKKSKKSSKYGKGISSKKSSKKSKKSPKKSKKSKSSSKYDSVDIEGGSYDENENYLGSYKVTSSKSKSKKSPKKVKSSKSKYSSKYSGKSKKKPPKIPPASKKIKKSPKSKKSTKSSKSGKGHTQPGEYYDLINSTKDGAHLDTKATRQLSDEDTNGSYKLPGPVSSSKSSKSKKYKKSSKYGKGTSSKKSSKKKSKKSLKKSKKSKSSSKYDSVDIEGGSYDENENYLGSYKVTSNKSKSKKSPKKVKSSKSKYSSKYSGKSKKKSPKIPPASKKSKKSPKSKKSKKSSKSGKGHTEPGEYYDLINSTKDGTHLDTEAARHLSDEADTNGSYKLPAQVSSSKSSKKSKKSSKYGKGTSSKKSSKKKSKKSSKKSKKSSKSSSKYDSVAIEGGSYDENENYSGSYKVTNSKSKSKKSSKKVKSSKLKKYSSKYSGKSKKKKSPKVPPASKKSKKSPKSKKSTKSSKSGKGQQKQNAQPGEYYDLINSTKDGAYIDTSATRRLR